LIPGQSGSISAPPGSPQDRRRQTWPNNRPPSPLTAFRPFEFRNGGPDLLVADLTGADSTCAVILLRLSRRPPPLELSSTRPRLPNPSHFAGPSRRQQRNLRGEKAEATIQAPGPPSSAPGVCGHSLCEAAPVDHEWSVPLQPSTRHDARPCVAPITHSISSSTRRPSSCCDQLRSPPARPPSSGPTSPEQLSVLPFQPRPRLRPRPACLPQLALFCCGPEGPHDEPKGTRTLRQYIWLRTPTSPVSARHPAAQPDPPPARPAGLQTSARRP